MQENKLTTAADQKKIQALLKSNFSALKTLSVAIYVEPPCQTDDNRKGYYYGTLDRTGKVSEFSLNECVKVKKEIQAASEELSKYYEGELEIPTDTMTGKIRSLYNVLRRYEHCTKDSQVGGLLNAEIAFGLLFFEGIKKNFGNYFQDDLKKVENSLASLTQEEVNKSRDEYLSSLKEDEKSLEDVKEQQLLLEKDPNLYIESIQKEMDNTKVQLDEMLKDSKYKAVYDKFFSSSNRSSQQPSVEEEPIFLELSLKNSEVFNLEQTINSTRKDPSSQKENLSRQHDNLKTYIDLAKKTQPLKVEEAKKIWIPTTENLIGKTRKEILDNTNQLGKVLFDTHIPSPLRDRLLWSYDVSTKYLVQTNTQPFSWHEFTGETDSPSSPMPLSSYEGGDMNLNRI